MWCDSAVFMDIIPECTNISVGYVNEHTFTERQDIEHLEKLVDACINTDWEGLPVKRDPDYVEITPNQYPNDYAYNSNDYNWSNNRKKTRKGNILTKELEYDTMFEMFDIVSEILLTLDYEVLNHGFFDEGEEMYFQNYDTGDFTGLKIVDYEIYVSEDDTLKKYVHIGDLETFRNYVVPEDMLNQDNFSSFDDEEEGEYNSHNNGIEYFTVHQDDTYRTYVSLSPDIIADTMDEVKNNKALEISTETWMELEADMIKNGIVPIYEDKGGINPDDLIEWIAHNWEYCVEKAYGSEDQVKKSKLKKEDKIFYDIALNSYRTNVRLFLTQVVQLGYVDKTNKYSTYYEHIETWIRDSYKAELEDTTNNINAHTFIDWVKSHEKDLLEYYSI